VTATILAHAGRIGADEVAIIGSGLLLALAFPALAAVISRRRGRRQENDQ
jgi:hypothetical protein